jgi:DNA-3-methyladenine glycosylase I
MSPWQTTAPRDDEGYFERMTMHIFSAGLNYEMVEKKRAAFENAFAGFSPAKVARFGEKEVRKLMGDASIVRNEKKIRSTIHNAGQFLEIEKEYGSFRKYLSHFGKDENQLQTDLQKRFEHIGPSTARMFLWSVAHPLTPNAEEKKWMDKHGM